MREKIINEILENGLIAIIRGVEKEKLSPLVEALYQGGIRLCELTYSQDGSRDDENAECIKMLTKEFEGKMIIGAGTVVSVRQAELTAKAGGGFVISPDTNPEVISASRRLSLVSIPGALTPSEITFADRSGADFVKLFPVGTLGAGYVKAIKAPLSSIRLLAVGGIGVDDIPPYLEAGVDGFGIGGTLTDKKAIESGNFAKITETARRLVEAFREAKK